MKKRKSQRKKRMRSMRDSSLQLLKNMRNRMRLSLQYRLLLSNVYLCASCILCLFIMLFALRPRLRGRLRVRLGTCTCTSRFTCYCI